ncbi:unnamed protein product [Caenorhabditis bovis]|uniref:Uncharacterized protein n=1 Tax=Caenorhabditis bovis TaxID=2654633 RepID=A0A8S1EYS4_9PELO|nr:unnamed protein product [Caenorhabditis bovis]
MGSSQSTSRAAKFSGSGSARRSMRSPRTAPSTEPTQRRATSFRNTNRNVKEFSKFWSDAAQVKPKSSSRASTKRAGSVRRNRTQSVDVRRPSKALNVPANSTTNTPTTCHERREVVEVSPQRVHNPLDPKSIPASSIMPQSPQRDSNECR